MGTEDPDEETLNTWHNDPSNWIWGFIYYNPQDKRILVLKRVRWMGITFNFGHRVSHLILVLILIMIVILIKFGH